MHQQTILIIEDDPAIMNFMTAILEAANYQVLQAGTGKIGMSLLISYQPALLILDLGLPDMDGFTILEKVRSWSELPIIIVSAREHESEKVKALDSGADDYITKPFGTSELLARIRTALRHSRKTVEAEQTLQVRDLSFDFEKRQIKLADNVVHLTPTEYKILQLLVKHQGKVLTHDFITKEVWGPYLNENQALRVNMSNIRRKIEKNPADPEYIITEVGIGYRFVEGN